MRTQSGGSPPEPYAPSGRYTAPGRRFSSRRLSRQSRHSRPSRGCGGGTSVYVGNDVAGRFRPPTCNGAGQRHNDTIGQPFAGGFDGSSTNIGSRASDLSKTVAATVIRGVDATGRRILGVGSDNSVSRRPPSTSVRELRQRQSVRLGVAQPARPARGRRSRQQHVDDPAAGRLPGRRNARLRRSLPPYRPFPSATPLDLLLRRGGQSTAHVVAGVVGVVPLIRRHAVRLTGPLCAASSAGGGGWRKEY